MFFKKLDVFSTRSVFDNCNLAIRKLKNDTFDLGPDCRPPAKEIGTSNFVEKVSATRWVYPLNFFVFFEVWLLKPRCH